jgi:hypothetical protein
MDISMGWDINGDEAPRGTFIGAAEFPQPNPISQEPLFRSVFWQDKPIGRVTTTRRNPGYDQRPVVFLCRYDVLFTESEHQKRNIAKTVPVIPNWFSP